MGTLMYLEAPEIIEIQGTITDLKVEKSRPLGFEHIPLDTTNPEHANIPINVNTYAQVNYSWQGSELSAQVVSWDENISWKKGDMIPLYLVKGEEEYPLNNFPSEAASAKKNSLIAGIAMAAAGAVLLLMGLTAPRMERRKHKKIMKKLRKMKSSEWHPPRIPSSQAVSESTARGNYLLGFILCLLGVILVISMGMQFIMSIGGKVNPYLVFPMVLGLGLFYLGSLEFFREKVILSSREVKVQFRSLWKRYEESVPLSSFGGIRDIRLVQERTGLARRKVFREFVLLHDDIRFNELSIKKVPENEEAEKTGEELSLALGLPCVYIKGEEVTLKYSENG